jgi:aspartate aminotransferase-like enzyme
MSKLGSIGYVLDRIKLLDIKTVFPHEAHKNPEVYSIMAAMNRVDPNHRKRMSPIPIIVRPYKTAEQNDEYVVLDGMHRFAAMKDANCRYVLAHIVYDEDIESGACKLGSWHEIVKLPVDLRGFDINDVFALAISDFSERTEDKLASAKTYLEVKEYNSFENAFTVESIRPKKNQKGGFEAPFVVLDTKGNAYFLVKEDQANFNLAEAIQAQIDFDESLELALMNHFQDRSLSRLVFSSDKTSASDFLSAVESESVNSLLVIRPSFHPNDIVEAARKRILVPKKTTRHEFPIRIFVNVPMSILHDEETGICELSDKMRQFINETYHPRYYPEGVFDFSDVLSCYNVSALRREDDETQEKRKTLESAPYREWAKEWAPPETYTVAVPGPVGYVDHSMAMGLECYMVGHRSAQFTQLYRQLSGAVRWLLIPEGGDAARKLNPYIIGGPASLAMETAALSSVKPDKKILHIVAGAFGMRWKDITDSHSMKSTCIKIKPGKNIEKSDLELIKKTLLTDEYDAVTMIHNETSTGCVYDPKVVYQVIAEAEQELNRDIMFLVDACSSFAGMSLSNIGLDNIDFLVLSTEKCLAVPPGISLLAASARGFQCAHDIEKMIGNRISYLSSLTRIHEAHLKGQTVATPAISQIYMTLIAILQISGYITRDNRVVFGEEPPKRFKRFAKLAELTCEWGKILGLEPVADAPSILSTTVTALRTDAIHSKASAVVNILYTKFGIELSSGHRHLLDENDVPIEFLRFAHMGNLNADQQIDLLEKVTRSIIYLIEDQQSIQKSQAEEIIKKCGEALAFLKERRDGK